MKRRNSARGETKCRLEASRQKPKQQLTIPKANKPSISLQVLSLKHTHDAFKHTHTQIENTLEQPTNDNNDEDARVCVSVCNWCVWRQCHWQMCTNCMLLTLWYRHRHRLQWLDSSWHIWSVRMFDKYNANNYRRTLSQTNGALHTLSNEYIAFEEIVKTFRPLISLANSGLHKYTWIIG